MSATVTELYRYYIHNNDAYTGTGVGFNLDTRPIQYPDNWGTNDRVTIVTDALGASRLDISGLVLVQDNPSPLRLGVNTDPTLGSMAVSNCVELSADGTGGLDVKLSPDTTYYVWLLCNGWSRRYADAGLVITASGSYGAPATPEAGDGAFGRALPITLTGGSAGASYTLTASCAGRTETLLQNGTATALSWTPALETYAALLPNAASAEVTFTCESFYAGVSVGTRTATATLRFPPGSLAPVPASGWATAAALNTGAAAGISCYVQGYSRAAVTFDSGKITCLYGASVAGYAVTCEGVTVSAAPYETPVLPGVTAALVCTVTDTRGQTATETLTVALEGYTRPALSATDLFRCRADGTADENGTAISVCAAAHIAPLNGENRFTLTAAARTLSGDYGAETALQAGVPAVLTGFSPDTAYELRLTLTDRLGSAAQYTQRFPTRAWAMKFRPDGNGVAFGKAAETDAALELGPGWSLKLHDSQGNSVALDYETLVRILNN